jgi:hypothetical protein
MALGLCPLAISAVTAVSRARSGGHLAALGRFREWLRIVFGFRTWVLDRIGLICDGGGRPYLRFLADRTPLRGLAAFCEGRGLKQSRRATSSGPFGRRDRLIHLGGLAAPRVAPDGLQALQFSSVGLSYRPIFPDRSGPIRGKRSFE